MAKITVKDFDPEETVYWGSTPDTEMSKDELLLRLRYEKWRSAAQEAADDLIHKVLMEQVYAATQGRRPQRQD
jgi:hypothetical protein